MLVGQSFRVLNFLGCQNFEGQYFYGIKFWWSKQNFGGQKVFGGSRFWEGQDTYEQVSVSSGVGWTGCWHEYKSLRKHGINFISKPIDKLDHRCAGKIFNFNFVCIAVVQNS